MRKRSMREWLILAALLAVPGIALSQAGEEARIFVVNGQAGQAPVVRLQGKSYVELEALARLTHGSLSFNGNQTTLTLPGSTGNGCGEGCGYKYGILERFLTGRHRGDGGDPGMAHRAYERSAKRNSSDR